MPALIKSPSYVDFNNSLNSQLIEEMPLDNHKIIKSTISFVNKHLSNQQKSPFDISYCKKETDTHIVYYHYGYNLNFHGIRIDYFSQLRN